MASSCKGKEPCVFVGKNDGQWVPLYENPYAESVSPYPPQSESWKEPTTTLMISISSFRDKLCPRTLYNIYTRSEYPQRIIVGVVQQNERTDVDCFEGYCEMMLQKKGIPVTECPYKDQIRMTRVEASMAQGPVWARSQGSSMIKNEEFCMQIDAHMDFLENFDTLMMEAWAKADNEYAILSSYVNDMNTMELHGPGKKGINDAFEVPHLCMVLFHGAGGMPRNWGTKCARHLTRPKMTNAVWGAGLSFSKCHAEKKVPYDIHLPKIFDGEEFSRAARFWTYGYDIYTPHRAYIFHDYKTSQSDPTHSAWMSSRGKVIDGESGVSLQRRSWARLTALLGMPGDTGDIDVEKLRRSKYGLGDRRSLEQLIEFSGIDLKNKKSLGNRCGAVHFVPFREHPKGPAYIPQFDENENPLDEADEGSIYFDLRQALDNKDFEDLEAVITGGMIEEEQGEEGPDGEEEKTIEELMVEKEEQEIEAMKISRMIHENGAIKQQPQIVNSPPITVEELKRKDPTILGTLFLFLFFFFLIFMPFILRRSSIVSKRAGSRSGHRQHRDEEMDSSMHHPITPLPIVEMGGKHL